MDVKELRIGNWGLDIGYFTPQPQPSYVQITASDLCNWNDFSVFIEPVPITPEILQKAGFHKYRYWWTRNGGILYMYTNYRI